MMEESHMATLVLCFTWHSHNALCLLVAKSDQPNHGHSNDPQNMSKQTVLLSRLERLSILDGEITFFFSSYRVTALIFSLLTPLMNTILTILSIRRAGEVIIAIVTCQIRYHKVQR